MHVITARAACTSYICSRNTFRKFIILLCIFECPRDIALRLMCWGKPLNLSVLQPKSPGTCLKILPCCISQPFHFTVFFRHAEYTLGWPQTCGVHSDRFLSLIFHKFNAMELLGNTTCHSLQAFYSFVYNTSTGSEAVQVQNKSASWILIISKESEVENKPRVMSAGPIIPRKPSI